MIAVPDRDACQLAAALLADVDTRLAHTRQVVANAQRAATLLDARWSAALVDAAWLHDIGYCPSLADTGFHPLDGARWLRRNGWREEVCGLVAWHTSAVAEAELRGLGTELRNEFTRPDPTADAALTWADLTASPSGQPCDAEWRLADILNRYDEGSVVYETTMRHRSTLRGAVSSTMTLLAAGRHQ